MVGDNSCIIGSLNYTVYWLPPETMMLFTQVKEFINQSKRPHSKRPRPELSHVSLATAQNDHSLLVSGKSATDSQEVGRTATPTRWQTGHYVKHVKTAHYSTVIMVHISNTLYGENTVKSDMILHMWYNQLNGYSVPSNVPVTISWCDVTILVPRVSVWRNNSTTPSVGTYGRSRFSFPSYLKNVRM